MNSFFAEFVANLLPLLLAAIAGIMAPPTKGWLDAHSHSTTLNVLVDAFGRAAQIAAQKVAVGTADTPAGAAQMVDYVRTNLPGTVAKLGPTPDALTDMATAILLQTLAARGTPAPNG